MVSFAAGRCVIAAVAVVAAVGMSGCATYSESYGPIQAKLAAGEPEKALELLESRDVPDRNRPLYLLDKAMLLRFVGNYSESNAAFEQAKKLSDALSVTSVSETTGSLVLNDSSRSYVGEPFEQALMHTYEALNYLELGDSESARVEALQVDERLRALAEHGDGPLAKNTFARYLSGIIYEIRGEWSDALISYRDAFEAFQAQQPLHATEIPSFLKSDLLRLTAWLGLHDEHEEFRTKFGVEREQWPNRRDYREKGELVFFLNNGLAPIKRERTSVVYPPRAERIITIALPYYQERPSGVAHAVISLDEQHVRTETIEDVNALAEATLKARMPGITGRAIIRAVSKYNLSKRAEKEQGPVAGLVANLAGLFAERADTRSWLTLPGKVDMARILAAPGEHKLRVELRSRQGTVVAVREFNVTLEKGEKTFLSYRWIPAQEGDIAP